MTLSEKIVKLRTGRGMSQGDLAEALEVSRQSVSKWETGQSVPDLDRIIRLADLFGVSVDELVRDQEQPEPAKPEAQVIYVEQENRFSLRPNLIVGILLEVFSMLLFLVGAGNGASELLLIAVLVAVVMGLPLLLAQKHPWLVFGWSVVAASYLMFNRWTSSISFYCIIDFLRGGKLTIQAIGSAGRIVGLLCMTACTLYVWKKKRS